MGRHGDMQVQRETSLLTTYWSIIMMIRWTGLAPWEFEFPFPGSLTSTFLMQVHPQLSTLSPEIWNLNPGTLPGRHGGMQVRPRAAKAYFADI